MKNVLWIQTDEQRPDSLGCYGSEWARTPNVDELARRGTTFHQCHVQSPMCVSSRTSMLFGRYPQETGVFSNAVQSDTTILDPDVKAVTHLFADAGYHTASLGKWHTPPPPRPTWQYLDAFIGYPDVADPTAVYPPFTDAGQRVIKNPGSFMDTVEIPVIIGGIYPYHDWGTDPTGHLTDLTIAHLREVVASGRPFFVRISYVAPHTPVLTPSPWHLLYDPDEVKCNAGNQRAHDARSSYDRWLARVEAGLKMPLDVWRQAAADYYGLCAYVDHEVGRLMQVLDELGVADSTIVAYNADHGRAMGEYGHCQKGTYDTEVWRVPFIIADPARETSGDHRHDLCELIDFARTLCGLAGIEPEPAMRGRDLFDPVGSGPDAVFGVVDMFTTRRAGVRTERYRYDCTYALDDQRLDPGRLGVDANLIDIAADPDETVNLIDEPGSASVAAELFALIDEWMSIAPSAGPAPTASPG
ncbi:MAG TPA: sulfatase-like hydrolase/transferase [Ilumatobacter sp.]|nr:sulfatase-like hydrolase/transferase [Ilumatobacter sp.]